MFVVPIVARYLFLNLKTMEKKAVKKQKEKKTSSMVIGMIFPLLMAITPTANEISNDSQGFKLESKILRKSPSFSNLFAYATIARNPPNITADTVASSNPPPAATRSPK